MSILVIGNGFDLAHKLPTQYSNFLDFIKAHRATGGDSYSKFFADIKSTNTKLYAEIQELIDNNNLLDYFLSIYQQRCEAGMNGWIDFEKEISDIIQSLDEARQTFLRKQPYTLSIDIKNFLFPIIQYDDENETEFYECFNDVEDLDYRVEHLLVDLNGIIRLLEIYLHEYIEKTDCKYRLPDIEELGIAQVLSFNYTDTYAKYYDPESKTKYCYIHGKTQNSNVDDCNMVLGIDEYLPKDRVDQDNQFVWFKKFYQRIYKQTDSKYLDWINDVESYNERYKNAPYYLDIYIYGHSLDVTDKDVDKVK